MKYKGITIIKNKNCNTWTARPRINGKQLYISAKTQKECYEKLKKAFRTITDENTKIKNITFIEWYDKWLKLYKTNKVKETTIKTYKTCLLHIPEKIKNKELKTITLISIIDNCKAERLKQSLYDLLNMLYKKAIDNEILDKNLIAKIEKPKHEKNHGLALTNEQQNKLLEISKKINADHILIAMYQGLRKGEVLGLTIDNIDFENNTLTINKAWNEHNQFDTTKNTHSKRTMPLFNESKKILLKYQNQIGRVFEISMKQNQNIIEKIKKLTNMPNIQLKDMRSTFITRCKELNIPNHIIQSWVGHKIGSTVTERVYTKHNTDIDNKYINILNESKFYSNSTQNKKWP